jgi:hypothetical protein
MAFLSPARERVRERGIDPPRKEERWKKKEILKRSVLEKRLKP